jgi:hypothetical protein
MLMHLPPGFEGMNFPLPRATIEVFASFQFNFFTPSLSRKGEGSLLEITEISPPPRWGRGRVGVGEVSGRLERYME